ncbi:dre4 [Acrasis kona]|uniref:FACT complex subunit n=1 Tax=Acrasis kona TaxID=1008807 RepID=A0AAW2ZKD4_9EUKA
MSNASVKLDETTFFNRLQRIFEHYRQKPELWGGVDSFVSAGGLLDSESEFDSPKSTVLGIWLLGYEFTETIMFFNKDVVHFYTNTKKVNILQPLVEKNKAMVQIHDHSKISKEDFLKRVNPGKKVGIIAEDRTKLKGQRMSDWFQELDNRTDFEKIDITAAIANLFVVHTGTEVNFLKLSGSIVSLALKRNFKTSMEGTIEDDKKKPHRQFADDVEEYVNNYKKKASKDDVVETAFNPIIQSGAGNYDLKSIGATSDGNDLHFGTIIAQLGVRYNGYCSTIARTYMVGPSNAEEADYNLLVEVYQNVLKNLKIGNKMNTIYKSARSLVEKTKPSLLPHFLDHVGYALGVTPCQTEYMINEHIEQVISSNMTICIHVGFKDVPDPSQSDIKKQSYSLLVADTFLIHSDNQQPPTALTNGKMNYEECSYTLDDEDDDEEMKENLHSNHSQSNIDIDSEVRLTRTREKQGEIQNAEDLRKKRQEEILAKKQSEFKKRGKSNDDSEQVEHLTMDEKLANGEVYSYKSVSDYPKELKRNKVMVDHKRETVLFPINGTHVPFHISTIKNVSKADENDYTVLRINFKTMQQNFGQSYAPAKMFPHATFIKEISLKSKNPENLSTALRLIQESRKRVTQRERDIHTHGEEVQQGDLILTRGANKPARLPDVYIRPGKKQIGTLECHENGLRFVPQREVKGSTGKQDILFSNIKHAFFQSATNKDIVVLLSFHLHSPLMIGKKTFLDIQFYTEVVEEYHNITGRFRQSTSEMESMEEERRERALKNKLNREFKAFSNKVEEKGNLEFESPYRDLEFAGTPYRSSVMLAPTVNCLVSLSEYPVFVLPLDEVEIVNFERIKLGLKNFDIVFVLKDYNKPVVSVNIIPIQKLDDIKNWLNQMEIKYFEGVANLAWANILKTIRDDRANWDPWSADKGWNSFLNLDDGQDDDDPEDNEEDDYNPSEDDGDESEDYNSEQDTDDDDEYAVDDDSDEGVDWDEMEKDAEKSDRRAREKRGDYSDEENEGKQPAKKRQKK